MRPNATGHMDCLAVLSGGILLQGMDSPLSARWTSLRFRADKAYREVERRPGLAAVLDTGVVTEGLGPSSLQHEHEQVVAVLTPMADDLIPIYPSRCHTRTLIKHGWSRRPQVSTTDQDRPRDAFYAALKFFQLATARLDQLPDSTPLGDRLGGVAAMLEGVLIALGCSGGHAAMHPATAIFHGG